MVHPKKVEDDTNLNASSIYGSSKLTQEADNVMILQKSSEQVPNFRRLQLIKNRYDGTVGEAGLAFNAQNKRYFELTAHERELFVASNGNIKKLIESRMNKYGMVEPMLSQQPEPLEIRNNGGENSSDSDDDKNGILSKVGSDLRFYEKVRQHDQEKNIKKVLKAVTLTPLTPNPLLDEFKVEL